MIDDLDFVYLYLYDLQKRIYKQETTHPDLLEASDMIKIINYTGTYSGGLLSVSTSDNTDISQYQELIIRIDLTGAEALDKKAIKFSVSSPTFSAGITETEPDDFEYTLHMIPVVGEDLYEIRLNEILGSSLDVGVANTCPIMFSLLDENSNEYNSNIVELDMYKTNLDVDYSTDDMSNVFITLSNLNTRLVNLES
jgi:hypothetical protein